MRRVYKVAYVYMLEDMKRGAFFFVASVAMIACLTGCGNKTATTEGTEPVKGAHVIAHRGFWDTEGSAQNSRTSLQKSIENGLWGSEIDVWLSADDSIIVNHDDVYEGVRVEEASYAECRELKLKNGENMPTLGELLALISPDTVSTKLIIEIKTHTDSLRGRQAAKASVEAVKDAGVEDKVEYIAFSLDICRALVAADSTAKVAYLNGDVAPSELLDYGITGIDYYTAVYDAHPEYVEECHKLGMTTNVWTVAGSEEIEKYTKMGLDFVTTDTPLEAKEVLKKYRND